MSDKTAISWTDSTWNPIRGCTVVSPGCTNCYAMGVAARFSGPGLPYEGLAEIRNGHPVWTGKVAFIEHHLNDPIKWKKPRRIFVNSMSDLFHERVSDEWLDRIFDVMEACPRHVFQILTKRPERMRDYMRVRVERYAVLETGYTIMMEDTAANCARLYARDFPHIWLGVSVEDQRRADERIPVLIATPAAVRFLSCEPLLGPVNFRWATWHGFRNSDHLDGLRMLDWIIVGGESGKRFRPMDLDWARTIRDQCLSAGVAFFYKQGSGPQAGKNASLDGVEWHQFPSQAGTLQTLALATPGTGNAV